MPHEKPRALRLMVEIAYGPGGTAALAADMGWSYELAELVLEQHARANELPLAMTTTSRGHRNVVTLAARLARR